jgi:hypothetical protein
MSDRDQQDECPKTFGCLPESCGDCPMDQQDEQAETSGMWFHLQHARWQMNPSPLRDQIDHAIFAKFDQNEVPGVIPMPPRTYAEGVRVATERHVERLRRMASDTPHEDIAIAYRMLAVAIERGEHKEKT